MDTVISDQDQYNDTSRQSEGSITSREPSPRRTTAPRLNLKKPRSENGQSPSTGKGHTDRDHLKPKRLVSRDDMPVRGDEYEDFADPGLTSRASVPASSSSHSGVSRRRSNRHPGVAPVPPSPRHNGIGIVTPIDTPSRLTNAANNSYNGHSRRNSAYRSQSSDYNPEHQNGHRPSFHHETTPRRLSYPHKRQSLTTTTTPSNRRMSSYFDSPTTGTMPYSYSPEEYIDDAHMVDDGGSDMPSSMGMPNLRMASTAVMKANLRNGDPYQELSRFLDNVNGMLSSLTLSIPHLQLLCDRYRSLQETLLEYNALMEVNRAQEEMIEQKEKQVFSLKERLNQMASIHSAEGNRLRNNLGALDAEIRILNGIINSKNSEIEELASKFDDEKILLKRETGAVEAAGEEAINKEKLALLQMHEEQSRLLKEEQEARIKDIQAAHVSEKAAISETYESMIKATEVKHEMELARFHEQRSSEVNDIHHSIATQLENNHAIKVAAIKDSHAVDIRSLETKFLAKVDSLKKEFLRKKAELDEAHATEKKRREEEFGKERVLWETEKEQLEGQIKYLEYEKKTTAFTHESEKNSILEIVQNAEQASRKLEKENERMGNLLKRMGDIEEGQEIKGRGDGFYIDAFTTLTKDIVDISHKFLDLPRMPPGDIIAQIPANLPNILADTDASRILRQAYIQHVISRVLCDRIFSPFLFSLANRYDNADSLLLAMSAHLRRKSTRKEAVWRNYTLMAAYTSSSARSHVSAAATAVIEEIIANIRPFAEPENMDRVSAGVRRVVKYAIDTWRYARLEKEMFIARLETEKDDAAWDYHPYEKQFPYITNSRLVSQLKEKSTGRRKIMLHLLPLIYREGAVASVLQPDSELDDGRVFTNGVALFSDCVPVLHRKYELNMPLAIEPDDRPRQRGINVETEQGIREHQGPSQSEVTAGKEKVEKIKLAEEQALIAAKAAALENAKEQARKKALEEAAEREALAKVQAEIKLAQQAEEVARKAEEEAKGAAKRAEEERKRMKSEEEERIRLKGIKERKRIAEEREQLRLEEEERERIRLEAEERERIMLEEERVKLEERIRKLEEEERIRLEEEEKIRSEEEERERLRLEEEEKLRLEEEEEKLRLEQQRIRIEARIRRLEEEETLRLEEEAAEAERAIKREAAQRERHILQADTEAGRSRLESSEKRKLGDTMLTVEAEEGVNRELGTAEGVKSLSDIDAVTVTAAVQRKDKHLEYSPGTQTGRLDRSGTGIVEIVPEKDMKEELKEETIKDVEEVVERHRESKLEAEIPQVEVVVVDWDMEEVLEKDVKETAETESQLEVGLQAETESVPKAQSRETPTPNQLNKPPTPTPDTLRESPKIDQTRGPSNPPSPTMIRDVVEDMEAEDEHNLEAINQSDGEEQTVRSEKDIQEIQSVQEDIRGIQRVQESEEEEDTVNDIEYDDGLDNDSFDSNTAEVGLGGDDESEDERGVGYVPTERDIPEEDEDEDVTRMTNADGIVATAELTPVFTPGLETPGGVPVELAKFDFTPHEDFSVTHHWEDEGEEVEHEDAVHGGHAFAITELGSGDEVDYGELREERGEISGEDEGTEWIPRVVSFVDEGEDYVPHYKEDEESDDSEHIYEQHEEHHQHEDTFGKHHNEKHFVDQHDEHGDDFGEDHEKVHLQDMLKNIEEKNGRGTQEGSHNGEQYDDGSEQEQEQGLEEETHGDDGEEQQQNLERRDEDQDDEEQETHEDAHEQEEHHEEQHDGVRHTEEGYEHDGAKHGEEGHDEAHHEHSEDYHVETQHDEAQHDEEIQEAQHGEGEHHEDHNKAVEPYGQAETHDHSQAEQQYHHHHHEGETVEDAHIEAALKAPVDQMEAKDHVEGVQEVHEENHQDQHYLEHDEHCGNEFESIREIQEAPESEGREEKHDESREGEDGQQEKKEHDEKDERDEKNAEVEHDENHSGQERRDHQDDDKHHENQNGEENDSKPDDEHHHDHTDIDKPNDNQSHEQDNHQENHDNENNNPHHHHEHHHEHHQ